MHLHDLAQVRRARNAEKLTRITLNKSISHLYDRNSAWWWRIPKTGAKARNRAWAHCRRKQNFNLERINRKKQNWGRVGRVYQRDEPWLCKNEGEQREWLVLTPSWKPNQMHPISVKAEKISKKVKKSEWEPIEADVTVDAGNNTFTKVWTQPCADNYWWGVSKNVPPDGDAARSKSQPLLSRQ